MMKPSVLNFGLIADIISFRSAIKSDPSSVEEMVITVSALEFPSLRRSNWWPFGST